MKKNEEPGMFDELLSFGEAAEIWGYDSSALRKAVSDGRLKEWRDCRKFGKQWVITIQAMQNLVDIMNPESVKNERRNKALNYIDSIRHS